MCTYVPFFMLAASVEYNCSCNLIRLFPLTKKYNIYRLSRSGLINIFARSKKHPRAALALIETSGKYASIGTSKPVNNIYIYIYSSPSKVISRRTISQKHCQYTFPNGKIIEVHQGDILNHSADYLVNSANDELKHYGGLALAIVERGGKVIQEESTCALNKHGERFMVGNVVKTGCGSLNFKRILHVVVPKHEGERDEGQLR